MYTCQAIRLPQGSDMLCVYYVSMYVSKDVGVSVHMLSVCMYLGEREGVSRSAMILPQKSERLRLFVCSLVPYFRE